MTGGDKALLANNPIAPTVPNAARTDKGMRNRFCLGSDEAISGVEFLEGVELYGLDSSAEPKLLDEGNG